MKVLQLNNVLRKDSPLSYRRSFTATAVIELGPLPPVSKNVEFVLEHSPIGSVGISVRLLEDLDYPLLPAIQAIRDHVEQLESTGSLP